MLSAVSQEQTPMKAITLLFITLLSPLAFAGDYATCLLDKLEGVQNDQAARSAIRLCLREHPGGINSVEKGSGRGIFGYDSGDECALDKASDTQSNVAGYQVRVACYRLYDKPLDLFDEFGIEP
ncbi:hypothetical protein [Halopseudomonas pachastrellae]|nr:hypothetical protein [Halopseudomonas pachastrellae]